MYYRYSGLNDLKNIVSPYEIFKDMNIFLIRHGETISGEMKKQFESEGKLVTEDDVIEDSKIELSSLGKEQSKIFGEKMSNYMKNNDINIDNTLVLISPFERTRQTYEIANEYLNFDNNSDNVYVFNPLSEQSYGAFHMIDSSIKKLNYEKEYNACQKTKISFFKPQFLGESPYSVSVRNFQVIEFIKEIKSKNKIKNVFIFGHRNSNKTLMMDILNLPPEFYDDFRNEKNLAIINIKNGKYNEFEL